nr:hypothetical protein [Telluribacter sp. SYSU D00476]
MDILCLTQVVPPSVVFIMSPFSPATHPVSEFTKDTDKKWLDNPIGVVLQVLPSVVRMMVPLSPTIHP